MEWTDLTREWQTCLEEAWSAFCAGSLPIGAAIASTDGQIVARGRNRLYEKSAEFPYITGRIAHAEINAVRALEHTVYKATDCIIFSTLEPCPMCLGAIRINRFKALHFAAYDVNVESIALLAATDFMRKEAPQVVRPFSEALEIVLMALLTETILRLRLPREMSRFHMRVAACPAGSALGKRLHESGELVAMREQNVGAAAMFDHLVRKIEAANDKVSD